MKKENNQFTSSRKVGMRDINAILAAPISRITTLRDDEGSSGFTLIELLVVILIVAILAAIALPQYNKAIWKSRATQLRLSVKQLAQAQEQYYLIHSTYPTRFDELDIAFDSFPERPQRWNGLSIGSNDGVRGNGWSQIVLNQVSDGFYFSTGVFTQGKYSNGYSGFVYVHEDKGNQVSPGFYCIGRTFCPQIMGLSNSGCFLAYGLTFYPM